LNQLSRELNRFFDDSPLDTALTEYTSWSPQVDIFETQDAFRVLADLPGVKSEDIEVSLHQGVLTIRGERGTDKEVKENNFARRERMRGAFSRQFHLPDTADEETVSAKSNNGVLEITIPKARRATPVSITVEGE